MHESKAYIQAALDAGADNAAYTPVSAIVFDRSFRGLCEMNSCGKYGRCWMCPPDVGDIDTMIARAKEYRRGVFFQTIHPLEDSFDIEGMEAAAHRHNEVSDKLAKELVPLMGEDTIVLGAGACHKCGACAKITGTPCRFPNEAISSLESYGIAVSQLAEACGMKYINGANTVTYFGGFLYDRGEA
ncbi:MAG: DUF2284 domain-containing protein [Oscillospiraceae bacterium]|nr:DUF2284 domain-containing protein [Oscillospiraceae bacterium]